MKIIIYWISFLFILSVVLGSFFYFNFSIVSSYEPAPASKIYVETVDGSMGSAITEDVGAMLIQNLELHQMMRLQGTASNKEYTFWLRGTCAQAAELVTAVTEVIRKHTQAPVYCTDPA